MGGGFFEACFKIEEGVLHTLSSVYYHGGKGVLFTPWNPSFNADNAETFSTLEYQVVWIQFLGLSMHLRNEACLKILASKLGRVLFVDNSSNHAGKIAGPRVKVLVHDYAKIPEKIHIGSMAPRITRSLSQGNPVLAFDAKNRGPALRRVPRNWIVMDGELFSALRRIRSARWYL